MFIDYDVIITRHRSIVNSTISKHLSLASSSRSLYQFELGAVS